MKKNKEIKYNHVGRPTNEEKKKYKKKKTLKIIGIISCIFIVVGGILLYINKDNLVMSGIMGNSVTNTMKSIQNNPNYKNTLVFKADAYDGKYLYQRYAESGNKKLVTYIYQALGFKDAKKYKAKAIRFYYNGKLLGNDLAYAKGAYIRLSKSAYGKSLSAIVYAQNLKTKKLEYKPIRIVVEKTGPFLGTKYDYLTDEQIESIAYLAYREQRTIRGAIFEAALMANRFELFPYGWDNIYEYIRDCEWWHESYYYMTYPDEVDDRIVQGVKYVLVNGYRPMPQYIDEHDCMDCGDIYKIVYNGKTITDYDGILNKNNYVKGKTTIYNEYTGIYKFYGFPTINSDPFGYSDEAIVRYKELNNK